ncbi:S8 family serine peptidase [Sphingomonas sp. RHCKR47]|uniref:S8 family serine peptidase n=1 Tax=Sphingomonas citricola TaxID=2862498 RepID=UPI001C676BB4|nr:S8 family serine peptidase [Sphingomonas citricola]MBW6524387.1 S8 family serine peptidase [Sphingomonas citricola]
MRRITFLSTVAGALALVAAPAAGQLLGGLPVGRPLGGLTGPLLGNDTATRAAVTAPLDMVRTAIPDAPPASLLSLRRDRLRQLVRTNRDVLDTDDDGNPVRRDVIVGIDLSDTALAAARDAGFRVIDSVALESLGFRTTTLAAPKGTSARKALSRLRAVNPTGSYTLDHVYQPAGGALALAPAEAIEHGSAGEPVIGLIDGGVGAHPAFKNARLEQRGFAGAPRPSGHGTAVASLLVGAAGAFRGAAPRASLLVADVYGGSAANGSAAAIVRAMAWLAQRNVRVINVSLVGPPNALLEAGVKALSARGVAVVAAVGNDGPAAPPQYPASYPGVVAVTGVDARSRALIEAGKPTHLDFAAPGAEMAGAVPGGGWEALRGTSFAAPLVAARLALRGSVEALGGEARPGAGRVGRGIVCGDCRTPPRAVGIR